MVYFKQDGLSRLPQDRFRGRKRGIMKSDKTKGMIRYYLMPKRNNTEIVARSCWACGFKYKAVRTSTCPRCRGNLPQERWRVLGCDGKWHTNKLAV
jgi:hypothetical protein